MKKIIYQKKENTQNLHILENKINIHNTHTYTQSTSTLAHMDGNIYTKHHRSQDREYRNTHTNILYRRIEMKMGNETKKKTKIKKFH